MAILEWQSESFSLLCSLLAIFSATETVPPSLMVAAVLTLLWRNVPGVTELTRLLEIPTPKK